MSASLVTSQRDGYQDCGFQYTLYETASSFQSREPNTANIFTDQQNVVLFNYVNTKTTTRKIKLSFFRRKSLFILFSAWQ